MGMPKAWENKMDNEIEYLREFIQGCTKDKIEYLLKCEKDVDKLRVEIELKDRAYEDLKKSINYTINLIKMEMVNEKDKAVKNKEYNIQEKKIKPLVKEKDRISEEKDRLQKMYDNLREDHDNIIEVLRELNNTVLEIKDIINKDNGSVDDVKRVLNIGNKERDIKMAKELANGKSKSEIASKYLGHRSQPMVALNEKLKSKRFVSLIEYYKGLGEMPEYYKGIEQ